MAGERPTRKLSIRLLREDSEPAKAYRDTKQPLQAGPIKGSLLAYGSSVAKTPNWAEFLRLPDKAVSNKSSFGVLFLQSAGRWFAISFGYGFSKLDPAQIEPDYGLRVVLNAVKPDSLYSADTRIPEEVTLTRRTQTSIRSGQAAFGINPEQDLMRAVAGEAKDPKKFGRRIAGSDGLTLALPVELEELPKLCVATLEEFASKSYRDEFSWVDRVRHIRDREKIKALDGQLVETINLMLEEEDDELEGSYQLVRPRLFDPEKPTDVQFIGFRSRMIFPDLDLRNYLDELRARRVIEITLDDLEKHRIRELSEDGVRAAPDVPVYNCLTAEVRDANTLHILSSGKWYDVEGDLWDELKEYFEGAPRIDLPDVQAGEKERGYNERIAVEWERAVCLDGKTEKAKRANWGIEVCDIYQEDRHFVHVKDEAISSKLSHLFSQGQNSAITFLRDETFRQRVKALITRESENKLGGTLRTGVGENAPEDLKVTYGVMKTRPRKDDALLPFFSLITFRTVTTDLTERRIPWRFGWAFRDRKPAGKRKPPVKKPN